MSGSSHTGPASRGVQHGKASILGWLGEQEVCRSPGLHLWGAQACLPAAQAGGEGKLKPHGWLTGFLQLPSPWPSLNRADAPGPLAPHHTPHSWGQNHAVRPPAGSYLRWSLSRVGTATVGVYTGIGGSLDLWWWPDYHILHPSPDQIPKYPKSDTA